MHETDLPLASQMAIHILAMNLLAPALILALRRFSALTHRRFGGLALATTVQLVAIWAAHAPALLDAMHGRTVWMLSVHVALFAVAFWFWHEVFATAGDRRWRAVVALLITAKLFCLLGALMVFGGATDDAQTAGLLMLVACPITYLFAAGVIARRWLLDVEARPAQSSY
jgi:putative membrane protein